MLCNILRKLRKERHITQTQLAEMLDLSQSTIASWENGSRRPDLDYLPTLASIYGVSVDDLLGLEEQEKEAPSQGLLDEKLVDLLVTLSPDQVQRVQDFVAGMKASEAT